MDLSAQLIRFEAKLLRPVSSTLTDTWTFLRLPQEASDQLPSRSMVSVEGTIKGSQFHATLDPDGQGGHWLKVTHELCQVAGLAVGDDLTLEISPTTIEPEPLVPDDFTAALANSQKASDVWLAITPLARRDWIQWITSGKRADTRKIRIEKGCSMLASGKRRPCCFDRSGMYSNTLSCPTADDSLES